MTAIEYVEKANSDGRKITNEFANGIDYLFIVEPDNWVSIVERNRSGYSLIIQACNREKALEYIYMREPINVPVRKI